MSDEQPSPPGLAVRHLTVKFGGLTAVLGVSLDAPCGRLTGLIGPNGAGKTTTFNACTGLVRPTEGTVSLLGHDVTRKSPQARGRLGLGRTFQRMELFDSLTVWENVAMGQEAAMADGRPWRHLVARRSQTVRIRQRAAEAMESCGISHLSDKRPANLSTGQRRLVELARVMAGDYKVLLLDEPSSGLDHHESESFGDILRGLVDDHGVAMLVVEHDMSLVMRVCEYIYVLDFGVPIFAGTPEAVTASSEVRSAYLGSDAVEAAVSERT